MNIEVLYVNDCPNHSVALSRLREVLASKGLAERIVEVLVRDENMARSLKFPGSPTIRINGRDVEPEKDQCSDWGVMCRLYSRADGAPSPDSLRSAIERALDSEV